MKKWNGAVLAAAALCAVFLAAGCDLNKPYTEVAGSQKKEKVLRVGSDINFPPFEFEENGKTTGFDLELAQALADKMGAKLEVKNTTFSDLIPAVKAGKIDAIMSGMEVTDARAKDLTFSDPYFAKAGYSILVMKDGNEIHGWDDLKGKVVGTQTGTRHSEISIDFGAERVQAFDEKDNVLKALKDKKVDAIVIDAPVAMYYARHDEAVKTVGDPIISKGGLAIGVKKGNTELQKEINQALAAVKQDGSYDKLYEKWFGEKP